MKEEKMVYKANKKAILIIFCTALIIVILGVLVKPVINLIHNWYLNRWTWHEIPKYGIEVKLPRAYEELEEKDLNTTGISSSAFKTDTDIEINETYVAQKPETVYYGLNSLNGIVMKMQCLFTERTDKTLEELADSEHILVRIAYEDDYVIGEPRREYINALDTVGIRTAADLSNEDGKITIINYLIPMDDKEVTISFFGLKDNIEKSSEEIEKIIEEMVEH